MAIHYHRLLDSFLRLLMLAQIFAQIIEKMYTYRSHDFGSESCNTGLAWSSLP